MHGWSVPLRTIRSPLQTAGAKEGEREREGRTHTLCVFFSCTALGAYTSESHPLCNELNLRKTGGAVSGPANETRAFSRLRNFDDTMMVCL